MLDSMKKNLNAICVQVSVGAGGRTRTGTVSLPVDFESTTSANSITPAKEHIKIIRYFTGKCKP